MRNEKTSKAEFLEVEPLGKCKVEHGRCYIVTMADGHLSGCGSTLERAVEALRRNAALSAVATQRDRKAVTK